LFENYIVAEVAKAYLHHRIPSPLFFWRDQSGHEIDLLIEHGNVIYPVEVKSALTVARDMFDSLKWWARLAGQETISMTLVYGGTESYTREGIAVRPWFSV
jgi:predicted AAA+ superfamily ATPase